MVSGGKRQEWVERISAGYIFVRSIIPQGQFVINELQDVYESMWILMKNINFKTIVSYETNIANIVSSYFF